MTVRYQDGTFGYNPYKPKWITHRYLVDSIVVWIKLSSQVGRKSMRCKKD